MSEHDNGPASTVWHDNRPSRGWRTPDLREIWMFRELLWFLAVRDVRVRYKQAALGGIWAVLRPAVGAAVFTVVFRHVAHVDSDGIPYLPFAYLSFASWAVVAGGVTASMASLVDNATLVTKVYFPRLIAPIAAALPPALDFLASLAVFAVLLVGFRIAPGLQALALPVCIGLLLLVVLSFGIWLSALNVQFRDITHITGLAIQVGLFVSPVAYPMSMIHGWTRYVYALNPLAGVLTFVRWSLLGGPWPGWLLAESLVVMSLLLGSGVAYFARVERRFADVI